MASRAGRLQCHIPAEVLCDARIADFKGDTLSTGRLLSGGADRRCLFIGVAHVRGTFSRARPAHGPDPFQGPGRRRPSSRPHSTCLCVVRSADAVHVSAWRPAHTHDRLPEIHDRVDATTAPKRTTCPQCGSKLPDIPVSLCPYCASPLETEEDRKRLESVNATDRARQGARRLRGLDGVDAAGVHGLAHGRPDGQAMPTSVAGIFLLLVVVRLSAVASTSAAS